MNVKTSPCILVAPLDWGLGHASRCMPLIDELLQLGLQVLIGASGRSLALLREEYPELPFVEFPPYAVRYSSGNTQIPIILRQVPRLLQVMRREHRLVAQLVRENRIHGIISDNRYGVWSRSVPSVFVCHQLAPLLPKQLSIFRKWVYRVHLFSMRKFEAIWVPDGVGENSLSGPLAHSYPLPSKADFIGPLSRFSFIHKAPSFSFPELNQRSPDIAVILSGPEPQRTLLEQKILDQATHIDREFWIVGGKTETRSVRCTGNICHISFMGKADLGRLLQQAKVVVSRSGYSSLMDYQALKLPQIILIPTPGQTEQEVLGEEWGRRERAYVGEQASFHLKKALENVPSKSGLIRSKESEPFRQYIRQFLAKILP